MLYNFNIIGLEVNILNYKDLKDMDDNNKTTLSSMFSGILNNLKKHLF